MIRTWSYLYGALFAVLILVAGIYLIRIQNRVVGFVVDTLPALEFSPKDYLVVEPWILPDTSRTFVAILRNRSLRAVHVEGIELSVPWAEAALEGDAALPTILAPGGLVRVKVTVKADEKSVGKGILKLIAHGWQGEQSISANGSATLWIVGRLNAEPSVVALGQLTRTDDVIGRSVRLWAPAELGIPREFHENVTVYCSEPCVRAVVQRPSGGQQQSDLRVDCGQLMISVDPKKTPNRMKAIVTISSGEYHAVVHVTGFTSDSTNGKDAR